MNIDLIKEVELLLEEEKTLPNPTPLNNKLKLVLDINKNDTKKGIKVQFIIPEGADLGKKEEFTQKLKLQLNKGLESMGLSVDTDLDVPYNNVIGFLIRLESFKLLIKKIIKPNG